ncbi:1,4-alpha-glucan branching protein GlgB [Allohahella marinimesophila]|uniref:1,4-alpha-glucan branching enzyme GlgB n=1 Tax=Allohahella marinimesophila TaxID=1054972 RepID=A0ABP7Q9H7_9GAMM
MIQPSQYEDLQEPLLNDLLATRCARPFDVLGWHVRQADSGPDRPGRPAVLTAWYPDAQRVELLGRVRDGAIAELDPIADGLFQLDGGTLSSSQLREVEAGPVRYRVHYESAVVIRIDPYAIPGMSFDEVEFDAATLYRQQGAQLRTGRQGDCEIRGVRFAVFAPHARSVSLVGDFNLWDGRAHPMGASGDGIWRLFLPEVEIGAGYKYEIRTTEDEILPLKTDPFGYKIDQYPSFASRVFDHDAFRWEDEAWREREPLKPVSAPINIYEVHLGSWRRDGKRGLSYSELATVLIDYVVGMGYTHIELLPVSEFPYPASWGYQPVGLYAATSRYGTPDELKSLINEAHKAGIGVIVDWVPAHFPTDDHGLANFDGTALYEYPDPKKGWHPDWKSLIYDFGREHVCQYLISNAMYWLDVFHIDGLRVDAVASMIYLDYSRGPGQWTPNAEGGNHNLEAIAFLRRLNTTLYLNHPNALIIAEESTAFPGVTKPVDDGGLGFGFKWNMGWMNDTLRYMHRDHVYRRHHHTELTFSLMYAWSENFVLPFSHDEVVHGKGSMLRKMPGDQWQKFANLRALACYQIMHPGKKLNFMGNEFGQDAEWNHDAALDWRSCDTADRCGALHRGLQSWHRDLNHLYREQPALYERDNEVGSFRWLVVDDTRNSVIAFARYGRDGEWLACIINLTPVPRTAYRVGLPVAVDMEVLLNSDSHYYEGSNFDLGSRLELEAVAAHGFEQSLLLDIPPLCGIVLKPLASNHMAGENLVEGTSSGGD